MNIQALVLYPQYGLANRLRALASAKILADYTGRKLFVNWYPSKECNIEWEELFVNTLERYSTPLSSFQAGINLYDDEHNADGFYWDMPQSLLSNRADVVAVHTCRSFQSARMSQDTYKAAKSLFYKSLQPVSAIQDIVSTILRNYFEGHNVIGIHVRRTDHLSFTNKDPKVVCPTDLFIEAMTGILKNNPDVKFFLATDDKEEELLIKGTFGDALIVYEKATVCTDTKKGIQDALIDWLLLSNTSRILGSYMSSFTEEAGIVNRVRTDTIPGKERSLVLGTHFLLLRNKGLKNYLLYSYYYRKEQVIGLIKRTLGLK